jgi:hypothetical protein
VDPLPHDAQTGTPSNSPLEPELLKENDESGNRVFD